MIVFAGMCTRSRVFFFGWRPASHPLNLRGWHLPQQFLDRTQRIRLRGLLDMMYSPADLARELNIDQRDVYRRWLPAGIPHVRDDKGHVLLHGLTIAKWFGQQKPKRNIKSDEGYCLKCKAVVKLIDPEPVQHGKFHLLRAPCPTCQRMVYRGAKHDQP